MRRWIRQYFVVGSEKQLHSIERSYGALWASLAESHPEAPTSLPLSNGVRHPQAPARALLGGGARGEQLDNLYLAEGGLRPSEGL